MIVPSLPIDSSLSRSCLIGGSVVLVSAGLCIWLLRWKKRAEFRQKAVQKKKLEQSYIKSQLDTISCRLDPNTAEKILSLSSTELLAKLQSGDLKPTDVLDAYLFKACKVTGSINCLTEVVRDCHDIAKRLNNLDPKTFPLYGLPVSVKECFETKGSAATVGLAKNIDNISARDSVIVKVLKQRGAVPFVKTNLSQMTMSFESSNPMYGGVSNPLNHDFSAGGSSGGESALIGGGGSLLGFGTDIGGSVRVPSHFCGICGLKPTKLRLSDTGIASPNPIAVSSTIGPLARDVDTLVLAMRAVLCDEMFEADPLVIPIKFRDEIYESKEPMRIGYFEDNGFIEPMPACKRAVRITKQALEAAGHTLVPFKMLDIEYAMDLTTEGIFKDGAESIRSELKYDRSDWCLENTLRYGSMNPILRKLYACYLRMKSPRLAKNLMLFGGLDKSAFGLFVLAGKIIAYKERFWTEWSEKYKIDALICPLYPLVACPKGKLINIPNLMSYSVPFNLLNCPAGTLPVTKVTDKDIRDLDSYQGHYGDAWDMHIKEACRGSINMPVGVQCVTAPWQEEKCLRLMKSIENLIKV